MAGYFNETARLKILADHDASDVVGHRSLDSITEFASLLCETPTALVSLVEEGRQNFISRLGLAATETPREMSFCQHAMTLAEIMVVPDASLDPRFSDNPLVTGPPYIRFYAGAPLRSDEGAPLGALCILDPKPREGLTAIQSKGLLVLADQVMTNLNALRKARLKRDTDHAADLALTERESRFRVLADSMPQMVWSTLPDGFHDYYNARWYEFTGVPEGSTDGEGWNGMFHPDDQDRAWATWRHSLETGDPYEIEYRLRHADGEYRWTLGRALPMRDASGEIVRWFGTCTDIHEQKLLLDQREVLSQELSHRIKNIFSIIAGMISLSARRHPEAKGVANDLRERVIALGRAHDFVRPHSPASSPKSGSSSLHGMLAQIFEPYQSSDRPRIVVIGFDPPIDDRSTTPLALLFHELATNALKYGALIRDGGVVHLEVSRIDDMLTLDWRESGGPELLSAPTHAGFGTQLIEMSAVRQLGAKLTRDWRSDGLHLSLETPLSALTRARVRTY